jgi:hypothetical protein
MSSQKDAHEILTDLDEIVERLRTTYDDFELAPCLPAHSLDRLNIEQALGQLIELRRNIVGYLDEWDHETYALLGDRGWL